MAEYERPPRVLVVEDDDAIAQVLKRSLRMEGYEVRVAEDGIMALDQAHGFLPDLVILDLGLPGLDGLEVARRLRRPDDDVPILVLTARDAVESRVEGLDSGADDYLVKPFERQELLARLRALLRRRPPRGQANLSVGDLKLNPDTHEVLRGDRPVDLTQREFELLEYLMRNERIVISRQRLLDEVWGYDPFSMTNTIEVFVSNLRRKLEAGGEPGSYIRSAARVTFSAYRRVPIRWRLAGGSAALTFVILAGFAAIVGTLTNRQVRGQFNDEVSSAVDQLYTELNHKLGFINGTELNCFRTTVHLSDYASAEHAQIRIFDSSDGDLLCTQTSIKGAKAPLAPTFFGTAPSQTSGTFTESGYRVAVRELEVKPIGTVTLLYARPLSDVDHTVARVQVFLLLGVLGGTILALLAGLFVSARAMRPIVELTDAAREIERTRDASGRVPHPEAEDEIAELARTLEGMLGALDSARSDTEAMLDRQREFVADASHELRTPLTSVLANLELLTEELAGEQAETAEAALRSTRRMRRLVGDLLLLARADARRVQPHRPTDLAEVLIEAAAELGPMAERHELSIAAEPAVVEGVRDELHRLVLNLLENAVRHTPPGTRVSATTSHRRRRGRADRARTTAPGSRPSSRNRVFERFVRGGRDGGRGSGLGLAIVRAVAQSHGGTVVLERPASGHRARGS